MNTRAVIIGGLSMAFASVAVAFDEVYLNNWVGNETTQWAQFEMTGNGLGWSHYNIGRNAAGKMPFDKNNPDASWSSYNITINDDKGVRQYCGNVSYAVKNGLMVVNKAYEGGEACYFDGFNSVTAADSGDVTVTVDKVVFTTD